MYVRVRLGGQIINAYCKTRQDKTHGEASVVGRNEWPSKLMHRGPLGELRGVRRHGHSCRVNGASAPMTYKSGLRSLRLLSNPLSNPSRVPFMYRQHHDTWRFLEIYIPPRCLLRVQLLGSSRKLWQSLLRQTPLQRLCSSHHPRFQSSSKCDGMTPPAR